MEYNEEMIKSLTSLIDETLEEMEEIKKSKFAAQEISMGDSDSGVHGKSKNGDMEAKKKEDKDEDEDDDMDKAEDCMDKGENEKADEDAGKFAQAPSVSKGENEKADQDAGKFAQAPTVSKKEDKDEDEDDEEKMDAKMKKSIEESEDLVKSYVDERFEAMQEQLSKMAATIEALADQPVERRAVPAGVTALSKSVDEAEPLSKSDVAGKLFDLKKSGQEVDSMDIFKVETGNQNTVLEIANKYGLR
jgi:hypothetical protein